MLRGAAGEAVWCLQAPIDQAIPAPHAIAAMTRAPWQSAARRGDWGAVGGGMMASRRRR
jgi:hypothetical protein